MYHIRQPMCKASETSIEQRKMDQNVTHSQQDMLSIGIMTIG